MSVHGKPQSPLVTKESGCWLESGRRESNPRSQLGDQIELLEDKTHFTRAVRGATLGIKTSELHVAHLDGTVVG